MVLKKNANLVNEGNINKVQDALERIYYESTLNDEVNVLNEDGKKLMKILIGK